IRSSSCFGGVRGSGEATCRTASQPSIASRQPSSSIRFAVKNESRSSASTCFAKVARSDVSREGERSVPRTRKPACSSCRMQCIAIKPDAPVTSMVLSLLSALMILSLGSADGLGSDLYLVYQRPAHADPLLPPVPGARTAVVVLVDHDHLEQLHARVLVAGPGEQHDVRRPFPGDAGEDVVVEVDPAVPIGARQLRVFGPPVRPDPAVLLHVVPGAVLRESHLDGGVMTFDDPAPRVQVTVFPVPEALVPQKAGQILGDRHVGASRDADTATILHSHARGQTLKARQRGRAAV